MITTGRPWDQQPGESDRDYSAFLVFLALGDSATKAAVAAKDGRSRVRMLQLSTKWQWAERCEAYHSAMKREAKMAVAQASSGGGDIIVGATPAETLINISQAQGIHLRKLSEYQCRTENLGNSQIDIAQRLFGIVEIYLEENKAEAERLNPGDPQPKLHPDIERLVRAGTMAATSGAKMVGDALGVEELFLSMQEHLTIKPASAPQIEAGD